MFLDHLGETENCFACVGCDCDVTVICFSFHLFVFLAMILFPNGYPPQVQEPGQAGRSIRDYLFINRVSCSVVWLHAELHLTRAFVK